MSQACGSRRYSNFWTLHLIFQKSQAWSHIKHFGGSEEQCYFNSDKPTLQPAFTLDQALQMPEFCSDAIKALWEEAGAAEHCLLI